MKQWKRAQAFFKRVRGDLNRS